MKKILLFFLIIIFFACKEKNIKNINSIIINQDSLSLIKQKEDSLIKINKKKDSLNLLEKEAKDKLKNIKFKPIWGNRLSISGDFDGDGIIDTLKECFISRLTKKETPKDYEAYNYDEKEATDNNDFIMYFNDTLINYICSKKPDVLLKCNNNKVNILKLPYFCESVGIDYLINVGDLNNDNRDEIAIVRGFMRFAGTTSSCKIYSYNGNKWKEVFSFTVHDVIIEEMKDKYDTKNAIPEHLVKKNGIWYYFDYRWNVIDGVPYGKMKPLKLK